MKQLLLFVITSLSFSLNAQTEDYQGRYLFLNEQEKGDVLKYDLQLHADHTFSFHFYRNIVCSICKEENSYGKGTWKVENKIIYFTTHISDLNQKYTLDFSGTTARMIKKSPRDLSDKIVPVAIQFYKSNIRWMEKWKLPLVE